MGVLTTIAVNAYAVAMRRVCAVAVAHVYPWSIIPPLITTLVNDMLWSECMHGLRAYCMHLHWSRHML